MSHFLSCRYENGNCYDLYFNTMKATALAIKDDKNGLACEKLLPDTPENAYTKCLSEALFNDDNVAALKSAKLLPQSTQQTL